jgi:large subunit ribosomal protein L25
MELQNLTVNTRQKGKKGHARRLRVDGEIPGILYGGDGQPASLKLNGREFAKMLNAQHGDQAVVQLNFEDQPELNSPALLRFVQTDPVRGDILHADFVRIRLDEKIQTVVSVVLTGKPKGVQEGGVLDQQLRELDIECLALDVPEAIEHDCTEMMINDTIHVENLIAPKGVEILTEAERAVASVAIPQVIEEPEAEEEGLEGEEGEEGAEGEEGEGGEEGEEKESE